MKHYSDIVNERINELKFETSKDFKKLNVEKFTGKYGLKKEIYSINSQTLSKSLKLNFGTYTIVEFPNILFKPHSQINYLINHLSGVVKNYLGSLNSSAKILIVALGNEHISADSLGECVIKNVMVTSTAKQIGLYEKLPSVYAFSAGVLGVTGIESYDVILGLVNKIKPNKIIVIDTLCASNFSRLGASFQVNNGGIIPGSGIENSRKEVSKNTTGVEVISVGVPLVVYAKTFLQNAVENEKIINEHEKVLKNHFFDPKFVEKLSNLMCENINNNVQQNSTMQKNDKVSQLLVEKSLEILNKSYIKELKNLEFDGMILTLKDIEQVVSMCGKIVAFAINKAITSYTVSEQKNFLNRL